jgi:hypothetical protein
VAAITLWVFVILAALEPFGLNCAKHKLLISLGTALAVFVLCTVFIQGLLFLFKNYYSAANWNKGKFLGISIGAVTSFALLETFVFSPYVDALEGPIYCAELPLFERFLAYYKASVYVGILPIVVIYYHTCPRIGEKSPEEKPSKKSGVAVEMEEQSSEMIELVGNTKECIRLYPVDMLYAKVSGNYVAVYYVKNDKTKVEYKFLRISLSQLSCSLQDYPYIIRCHRAFLVNTMNVIKFKGNSRGYRLEVKNTNAIIPVSKSYIKTLKQQIPLRILLS